MIPFGEHRVDEELRTALSDTADELIRLTGADLCDWSGAIEGHPLLDGEGDPAPLGIAHWDGTISLRADVLSTLRDLWERSPRVWSDEDREEQRPATLTVAHELAHYLVPVGERYANGRAVYGEFPGRALEEGVTELAGRKHVGAFAGAEARSPGVADARNAGSYPQFVRATEAVLRYVGELRGEREDAVLNALVRQTVPGKFRTLGQMVLEAGGTWEHIPSAEKDAACAHLINAMWGVYSSNRDWAAPKAQDRPTRAPKARSRIMGLQLVAAMEGARLEAVDRYGPERPATPWPIAAAQYEYDLTLDAMQVAQSSNEPDVRAAADAWRQRAGQRLQHAWQEVQRPPQEHEPRDPSRAWSPERQDSGTRQPELAAVPSLAEPPRPVRHRRPPQRGVHRRAGRSDPGRDR